MPGSFHPATARSPRACRAATSWCRQGVNTRDMGAPGLYALDTSTITRDSLDRKVRLRMDGRRLVPYYTREEIETRGAPNAKVLAFVNNAFALYEMQIQGSGRVRLPNGEIVRVAYAEQNGQPFRPTLAQNKSGDTTSKVRTRGGAIELELDNDDDSDDNTAGIRVRGFTLARPEQSGAVVVPGRASTGPVIGSGIKDPSYVFFKESLQNTGGPVGAFGVPLSAGRSIAVDPRSTPLGYPVFVSTRQPGTGAPMQRLTIAQDTGGAIRGAVRADYFFGNGQQAATDARRMKERGQLWILLPRGQCRSRPHPPRRSARVAARWAPTCRNASCPSRASASTTEMKHPIALLARIRRGSRAAR